MGQNNNGHMGKLFTTIFNFAKAMDIGTKWLQPHLILPYIYIHTPTHHHKSIFLIFRLLSDYNCYMYICVKQGESSHTF